MRRLPFLQPASDWQLWSWAEDRTDQWQNKCRPIIGSQGLRFLPSIHLANAQPPPTWFRVTSQWPKVWRGPGPVAWVLCWENAGCDWYVTWVLCLFLGWPGELPEEKESRNSLPEGGTEWWWKKTFQLQQQQGCYREVRQMCGKGVVEEPAEANTEGPHLVGCVRRPESYIFIVSFFTNIKILMAEREYSCTSNWWFTPQMSVVILGQEMELSRFSMWEAGVIAWIITTAFYLQKDARGRSWSWESNPGT